MFLNAHQRFLIPAVLGDVAVFNKVEDPATRVPDVIAFQNDSDMDVTLHFDAGNFKAQVTSTEDASGGLTVVNDTSDKIKVAIDGEEAITIDLTAGARTRAQIITDINAAFAAASGVNTKKAKAILIGTKYIAIVSGTTGQFSSVDIQAVTNAAYTLIGLAVGTATAENSFTADIVAALTIKAKGLGTFTNPRKNSPLLKIRGVVGNGATGVNVMVDATTLFAYGGVQQ